MNLNWTRPKARRRGAALISVLIFSLLLATILLVLTSAVGVGFSGTNARRFQQETLASSDDVSERLVHDLQFSEATDPVDSVLVYGDLVDSSGTPVTGEEDWSTYFEAALADESRDVLTLFYDQNGAQVAAAGNAAWQVQLRSAYRTWRNDNVQLVLDTSVDPTSLLPLPRVTNADRISLVRPVFDYYLAQVDNTPGLTTDPTRHRGLRQAQVVYRVEKPYYPSALYLDGGSLTITDGIVDGRDHLDVTVEDSVYLVPFNSKVAVGGLPRGSAGYHHSLHYVDPVTGEEQTIFNDSHSVWSGSERAEVVGNFLKDADGNEVEFDRKAPLDFYINTWQGNNTIHHLFGHNIDDPSSRHNGKRYGYAWNEVLHVKADAVSDATKRADLGDKIYTWLKNSAQVERFGGDLTSLLSNPTAFKSDPFNGGTSIQTYGSDIDGDGNLEVDDDVDDNGALNRWTSGDSPLAGYDKAGIIEDRNNNGVRDDDDRRLANAIQDYFFELQNDTDTSNDVIDRLELVMGFEDLDVGSGENPDWDFNDVFLQLDFRPTGNVDADNLDPPSFSRAPGIDAVISGAPAATYGSSVLSADPSFVRTAYGYQSDGSTLDTVFAGDSFSAKETPYLDLMEGFLAAPDVTTVTGGGVINDHVGTTLSTDAREPAVVHIQNSGGAPAILEGDLQGEGVLIVEGDLLITDHVVWRGSIIVRGNLTLDGDAGRGVWVFGSVMVTGDVTVQNNSHICYSSSALEATRNLQPRLRPLLRRIGYRRPL